MKRNKLVIAMGLAGAVLVGCNSSGSDDKKETTAIDGYIVNGLVTMKCTNDNSTGTFTGRTDNVGIVRIDTASYSLADCTSSITGDAGTYDYDQPALPWLHTMKTIPGLAVINPFTDIAALLFENDPTLEGTALLEAVYAALDIPASLIPASSDLFVDFGTNNVNRVAKMSVLSESVFATIVKLKDAVPAGTSAKNLVSLFKAVLPKATSAVVAYIAANPSLDLTKVVFIPALPTLPVIEFDADGDVTTDLSGLDIAITHIDKPAKDTPPQATGATGATGGTGGIGSSAGS